MFCMPEFDQACFFHRTGWYQPKRWIRPVLTPPKLKKDYYGPCKESVNVALSAVGSADEIWIFGWSMPQTDKELVASIATAIKGRSKPIRWLRIVDVEGGNKHVLEKRAREVFMPDQVQTHWGGLETWRDWPAIRHP